MFSDNKVFAAETDSPTINLDCKTNPNAYPWCQEAKQGIAPLVNNFYKIALGFAGASALGVLIYGAILWTLSGAVTSKQDAKEWISGALWGLALLLGAYLILWTINPQLIELKDPMKDAPEVSVPVPSPIALPLVPPIGFGGNTQTRQDLTIISEGKITVNNIHPIVTNLGGLRNTTTRGIVSLWRACGECNIVISGGTEPGHAEGIYSHTNGYKLDLHPNATLNSAINKQIGRSGSIPPPADTNYKGADGNIYRYETDHWDVCFQCR
ncbi:MAG: hypothetical protein Q8N28_00080 [bacterium]|nr:hypothetical protein [bacterium]